MRQLCGLVLCLLVASITDPAQAACTSPAAEAGARQYFSANKNYKFCDGTNWVDFKTAGVLSACTSAGTMEWDTGESAYKLCDGTSYLKVTPACTISSVTYKTKVNDATNLNYAMHIHLSADRTKAYTSGKWGGRVSVYDISNPSVAPTRLGTSAYIANIEDSMGTDVFGNYMYQTGRSDTSLSAINIGTTTPTFVSRIQANPTSEMANIWGVAVRGDGKYAFTVSWASGAAGDKCWLHAINISNPAAMTIVGKLNITDVSPTGVLFCNQIKIKGNIAYISNADSTISTVDISNPVLPVYLAEVVNANAADIQGTDFSADGNYLMGTTYTGNKFNVFNISNPSAPTWSTSITNGTAWDYAYYTRIVGNYAFVTGHDADTFTAVNVATPTAPSISASYAVSANLDGAGQAIVHGRYAYVTTEMSHGITLLDLGCDPAPVINQGACSTPAKIEYFPTTRSLAYCDGTNYKIMAQADVTPSSLDWPDFSDVSQSRTVMHVGSTIDLELSYVNTLGTPTVQYRKNGGGWTTFTTGAPANVTFTNGDTLEFQVTGTTNHSATITVKNLSDSGTILDTMVGTVDYDYYYYVPNNTAGTISVFKIASDGGLSAISGSPFAVSAAPYSAVVDPQNKFLYVTHYSGNNVRVYTLNQTTGAIGAQVSGSPYSTGNGPTQVHITPDGKFAYTGNYSGNSISAFTVNSATGQLTAVSGSPYAVGSGAVADVQADPASKFLYAVCDVNASNLYGWSINTTTGQLTALASFPKTPGRTPQTVVFDGTGTRLYTANWGDNNIGGYSFNSTTGALTLITGSPWATGTRPNSVVTDSSGKMLFSANSTANTVTTFKITAGTGALTSISGVSFATGGGPWDIQLDPRGKFVYSVNKSGNNVTALQFSGAMASAAVITGSPFATGTGPQSGGFAKIARP